MLVDGSLSVLEKRCALLLFVLLLVGLFMNLGIYPLTLEEPRRGLIALEMIFSDNWIVPTQTGELYFRKPPVYNWLLILSYKLFGSYSELATRFFSVASFVVMGLVFYRYARKYVGERFAVYGGLFFLVSVDILYYFSTLGEIDLFYSLLTLLVFMVIYDFGEKKKYYALFMLAYFLSAIGFLTKGLPSLPFLGITLLVYFIMKRDFKRLFSLKHLVGGLVFIAVVGGYFWWYSQYADPAGWKSTLLSESSDRATKTGIVGLLKHMLMFPLDTLKNVSPAALMIPFLFRKDLKSTLKERPFVFYIVLVFLANMLLYWVSVGARSRYVYALYPLVIGALVYMYFVSQAAWKSKALKITSFIIPSLFIIVSALMSFAAPQFEVIDNLILKSAFLVACGIALLWAAINFEHLRLLVIVAAFVVTRIGFSMTTPVLRAQTSGAANDKQFGLDIASLSKGSPLYLLGDTDISRGITFYIEAAGERILTRNPSFAGEGYWICTPADTAGQDVEIALNFRSRDTDMLVVTKKGSN